MGIYCRSTASWRTVLATVAITLGLPLSSCASSSLPVVSVSNLNSQVAKGYTLGTGDKLNVIVFDEPTLSGEFEVGEDGNVALPLVGEVAAVGKVPSDLAQSIATKLVAGGYVLEPRISISVLEYRPFYILGEVNKPGEYPYSGDLTLQQAVAKAGGYTPRANKNTIEIQRQDWAGPKRVKLDDTVLKIAPGDTLTINEAFF